MKAIWSNRSVEAGKKNFLKDLFHAVKEHGMPEQFVGGTIKAYGTKRELQKVIVFHDVIKMQSIPLGAKRAWYKLKKLGYTAEIKDNDTHSIIEVNAFPTDLEEIFEKVTILNKHVVARYKGATFELKCRI